MRIFTTILSANLKSIMVNFNPIKVYDVDTTARGIDDENTIYYITEIKLVPINNY